MARKKKVKKLDAGNLFKKHLGKNKSSPRSLQTLVEKYKPNYFVTTQFPNLDMLLCWDDNAPWVRPGEETGEKNYGLPGNRVIEIYGESGAFKTYLGYMIPSEVVRQDGYALNITTEYDVSLFPEIFYEEKTMTFLSTRRDDLDFRKDIDGIRHEFAVAPSFEEAEAVIGEFIKKLTALRKEGFDGPACIVLDSITNLRPAKVIKESLNDDPKKNNGGGAYGSGASEKHHLLGLMCEKCAELDFFFLYLNQTRDNLSGYGIKRKAASDNVVKWYPSLRIYVKSWNGDAKTLDGIKHKYGTVIQFMINKKRGFSVGDGKATVQHFEANDYYGFDEMEMLAEASALSGLFTGASTKALTLREEYKDHPAQKFVEEFMKKHLKDKINKSGSNAGTISYPDGKVGAFFKETVEIEKEAGLPVGKFVMAIHTLNELYGPIKVDHGHEDSITVVDFEE
ncbi:MAG: hypothetical protein CL489_16550 [Acidobacteria bacterium]|nr:hypothetical protein [Acidobacteriota bacterium]|tara:strand:+ start:127 stop:1482 length:1356 start_codon:yes stop_codon:yes gene_type:complete